MLMHELMYNSHGAKRSTDAFCIKLGDFNVAQGIK